MYYVLCSAVQKLVAISSEKNAPMASIYNVMFSQIQYYVGCTCIFCVLHVCFAVQKLVAISSEKNAPMANIYNITFSQIHTSN